MEAYIDQIRRIVVESDVVLEILDARLVELSRNEVVEELVKEIGRPMIFVLNKSDLTSKESIKKQIKGLKDQGEIVFISTKKKGNAKILYSKIKQVFKKYGKREIEIRGKYDKKPIYREARGNIVVGVVGYPNVGKSSIINMLSFGKKAKVSKKSGTTHGVQWVNATKDIKLIDSPGVIPLKEDDEIRYGLIGAKSSERLSNIELVSEAIIKLFLKNNRSRFCEFYNIEIKGNESSENILNIISEKKGHLLKGGKFDINRSASMIIRDWQNGKLRL